MTGLHKFLICLLAVVVAVSLGVTVYYFARPSGEELTLSANALSENLGDEFTITINQVNANKRTELKLVSDKENIVEFVSKDAKGLTYTFKAKAAGHANVSLITNNENYTGTNRPVCGIDVADGSAGNPYYIRNADDLLKISSTYGIDKHYRQIANVDLNGKTFSPIGPTEANAFTGSYNGGEYTISNLTLNTDNTYAGMFGVIANYAVVSNVKLADAMISGTSRYLGSIAGYNKGKILDCAATNSSLTTTAADSYAGGVAGQNDNIILTSSYTGEIASATRLGGVVAFNHGARVQECYARGEFTPAATTAKMGGVVAENVAYDNNRANVVNCYSTVVNKDTTNANMGMILYNNINTNASTDLTNDNSIANRVYGNYYVTTQGYAGVYGNTTVSPRFVSALANKSSVQSYATYAKNGADATWNFTNIWAITATENDGYPTHKTGSVNIYASNVYVPGVEDTDDPQPTPDPIDSSLIDTAAKLNALANQETLSGITYSWDKDYYLGADIDLGGANWSSMRLFAGSLNGKDPTTGQRHTISNFKIVAGEDYYVGFANELTGVIKNIKFNNITAEVTGSHELGIVAGNNKGTIFNVDVNGVTFNTTVASGGIVARNDGELNTVKVEGINTTLNTTAFGGIAYLNGDSAIIREANVTATSAITINGSVAGGIVAVNSGAVLSAQTNVSYNMTADTTGKLGGIAATNSGKLEEVEYKDASLTLTTNDGGEALLGGIAASNTGEINAAKVTANSLTINGATNAKVGAIAGESSGDVTHAIATVTTITSKEYAGGLVGAMNGGTVSASGIANTATVNAAYVGGLAGTMNSGTIANSYTKATLNGSEESCGMACAIKSGARVENCYIGAKFANDASGRKFETQTKIRQGQGGSVSNNVINVDAMGGCSKGDSKRQYGNWYIPVGLPGNVWFELNTPDDNLYSEDSCTSISTYTDKNWPTGIWTFADGSEPYIL